MELHTIHTLVKTAVQQVADIVCAKFCSEYIGETVHLQGNEEQVQVFHGKEILPAYARGLFREVVWNKLYSSDCLSELSFPDGHNYEDVFTTWKRMKKLADKRGTVVSIQEELFHFRIRKSSISHTVNVQNIIDFWKALHEKYEGLPEYQEEFTTPCHKVIIMMWLNYTSFTREEKRIAKGTVLEMSNYSKATFFRVMREDYPLRIRNISLLSLSASPLLMWICYNGGRLYRLWRKKRTGLKMFD
jgi:hypothetical protein